MNSSDIVGFSMYKLGGCHLGIILSILSNSMKIILVQIYVESIRESVKL